MVRPLQSANRLYILLCRDEEDSHLFASDLDASQALIDAAQSVIQAAVRLAQLRALQLRLWECTRF